MQKRKEKKDLQKAYLDKIKDRDTLRIIYIGDSKVQMQEASPDARFIAYKLFEAPADKKTIVPNYVTESGYTATIEAQEKEVCHRANTAFMCLIKSRIPWYKLKWIHYPALRSNQHI